MGGEHIVQDNEVGRFIGRVSINTTRFTSKLVISPTNYGDSGVYQFDAMESDVPLPSVNFYISLPPRPAESELSPCCALKWCMYACLSPLHSAVCSAPL